MKLKLLLPLITLLFAIPCAAQNTFGVLGLNQTWTGINSFNNDVSVGGTSRFGSRFLVQGSNGSTVLAGFVNNDFNGAGTGSGVSIQTGAASGNTYGIIQGVQAGGSSQSDLYINPNAGGAGTGQLRVGPQTGLVDPNTVLTGTYHIFVALNSGTKPAALGADAEDNSTGNTIGLNGTAVSTQTSGTGTKAQLTGVEGDAFVNQTGPVTAASGVVGVCVLNATSTVGDCAGVVGSANLKAGSTAPTNAVGLWAGSPIKTSGPAPTNAIGVHISPQSGVSAGNSYGIYQDSTGDTNFFNGPIAAKGNTVTVSSDFTTASASFVNITGLSGIPMTANNALNVPFTCELAYSQATAAVADQFGVQFTTLAPTTSLIKGEVYTNTTVITAANVTIANTTATSVVTFTPSAITTIWNARITGMIESSSSATPSVFNLMVLTGNASDSITVKRDSFCRFF